MTQKSKKTNGPKQKTTWTDFKDLKTRITMEMVLDRYGLLEKLKPSGTNLVGTCPIHQGHNPRQFSVSLAKNAFNCFGRCQAGGNILDFVTRMEKIDLRQAALLLQEWFPQEMSQSTPPTRPKSGRRDQSSVPPADKPAVSPPPAIQEDQSAELAKTELATEEKELINPPLKFALKNLNPDHPFLHERGITAETAEYFGLGFCSKGMMRNRLAVPIHDHHGHLVAYAGRAVSEEQAKAEGKYMLPPGYVKKAVVYNLHRQAPEQKTLFLVESFLSVVKGHQIGVENVVALFGSTLSKEQENLITGFLGPSGHALLLFDTDESGQACATDCLQRLGQRLFVKRINLETFGVRKPHQLSSDDWRKIGDQVTGANFVNVGGDHHAC